MKIHPDSTDLIASRLQDLYRTHGSWLHVANHLGVASTYLGAVVRGKCLPGPKILSALGLELVGMYVAADGDGQ